MLLNLAGYLTLAYFGACLVLFVVLCLWDRIALRREPVALAAPYVEMICEPDEDAPLVHPSAPRFCPACVVIAREHDLDVIDEGFPKLCAHHIRTLAQWNKRQPGIMATAITGLHLYAMRSTHDDE